MYKSKYSDDNEEENFEEEYLEDEYEQSNIKQDFWDPKTKNTKAPLQNNKTTTNVPAKTSQSQIS